MRKTGTKPSGGSAARTSRAADGPRRIRHGQKLSKEPAVLRENAFARRWLDIVEMRFDEAMRMEGLEYARAGQVAQLAIAAGTAEATVQGRAAQPYKTRVSLPVLNGEQWRRLIAVLAADAGVVAKLLADSVPAGLLELTERTSPALLPPEGLEVEFGCTCGGRVPCKHVVAVAYLVAFRLFDQPLIVFDLRGMPGDRLLERLRQVRAIQAYGVAAAHSDPLIPASQVAAPNLESSVEDFWRAGPPLAALTRKPPAEYAPQALLRRLGPSPLPGKFPLVGLLASIYDTVADRALELRDHAEQIEEGPRS
ncbi:MAG: SWIM zinc finger family protein [Planctomycetota bacterium]